ncbi:MAG: hypothetical protein AAGH79_07415 [Bacteroidota bacterium]
MPSFTPLMKYLGLFIVLYFGLLAVCSIPNVSAGMASAYRGLSRPIIEAVFPAAYLRFNGDESAQANPNIIRVVYASQAEVDRQTELARQQGTKSLRMNAASYDLYFNLLYTTFFLFLLTLIILTPISWIGKAWAFLWGTLLFTAFTLFKVAIFLLDQFNKSSMDMYQLSESGGDFVAGTALLLKSLGFSSFIVILIWVLVTFRRSTWAKVLQWSSGAEKA